MNNNDQNSLIKKLLSYVDVDSIPEKNTLIKELCHRINEGAFISYAQNYEDVILNRVFKSLKNGIYVDVGAYHPFVKSTTCLFYLRGWHGVNIDICINNIKRFEKYRPDDINICAAVGSQVGEEEFYVQKGTTRTTKDKVLAQSYRKRGINVADEKHNVQTLTEILFKNDIKHIDFLSVDVEGSEEDVFRGINFNIFKPTVIVAEATYPETNVPNWGGWEKILISSGYRCIYFDGLNRFYIQNDRTDLIKYFDTPPNYFDNFIKYECIINVLSNYQSH